jgi:hypothetical protein
MLPFALYRTLHGVRDLHGTPPRVQSVFNKDLLGDAAMSLSHGYAEGYKQYLMKGSGRLHLLFMCHALTTANIYRSDAISL